MGLLKQLMLGLFGVKEQTTPTKRRYSVYHSVCWQCRCDISSAYCTRCPICGWFVCDWCGACSNGNQCISSICTSREERKIARDDFQREHGINGISREKWIKAYSAKLEEQRAEQARKLAEAERKKAEEEAEARRKKEEERRKKAEEEAAARIARQLEEERRMKRAALLRKTITVGMPVYSETYGPCAVADFYKSSNGKIEYLSITTPEGIKKFVFPNCFDGGYLRIPQEIAEVV